LVSVGSYAVATDGIMGDLVGVPSVPAAWAWDNPREAALRFAREDPRFVLEEPALPFNEGAVTYRVTYWPSAYLKRAACHEAGALVRSPGSCYTLPRAATDHPLLA